MELALCDSGATGLAFIDDAFARQHNIPKLELRIPRAVDVTDSRPISDGDITHIVKIPLHGRRAARWRWRFPG